MFILRKCIKLNNANNVFRIKFIKQKRKPENYLVFGFWNIQKIKNYCPNKCFFKVSSTGLSESQIPNNAFLKSNPGIFPFSTSFLLT